jgi:hypothetical protein
VQLQRKAAETLQLMQSSYAVAASSASHAGVNKFLQKSKVKGKTSGKEKHIFVKVTMVSVVVNIQIRL